MKNLLFLPILLIFLPLTIYTHRVTLEDIPHSQDEVAYLFQAKIFASGRLFLPSLPDPARRFFDQEFIVNNGKWFGKYPPGQPILLTLGQSIRAPWLINPLFGAAALILLFLLTDKLFSLKTALLTTLLFSLSPFNILISASFLSHTPTLFFTLLFFFSLIHIIQSPDKKPGVLNLLLGLSAGIVILLRPYNSLPLFFSLVVVFLLLPPLKIKQASFLPPLALLSLLFVFYNYALTGSFFTMPQQVYSPYDFIGFGLRGVEWGLYFTPQQAISNLGQNYQALASFLFAWPGLWLILFIPLALLPKPRRFSWLLLAFFACQILVYFFYFHPGTFLGPRYWFEASWVLLVLTAQGIVNSIEFLCRKLKTPSAATFILSLLVFIILYFSLESELPFLASFQGYNGMSRPKFTTPEKPSIVFVPGKENWQAYGQYFMLQSPILDQNQIIFARDRAIHNVPKNLPPVDNELLKEYFPSRKFYFFSGGTLQEIN